MTVSLFVRFFLCKFTAFGPAFFGHAFIVSFVFISSILSSTIANASDEDWYYELAKYHAPVIYQQTDSSNPTSNYITNFDFDGDFYGNNNWDNADDFSQPAYVYYSVFDTTRFYYIFYGVFHPRKYASRCLHFNCHENDFSGAMVVVRKSNNPYGTIDMVGTFVETLFGGNFYSHQPSMTSHFSNSLHANSRDKLALWIQDKEHNLYVLNESRYQINHHCIGGKLNVSSEDKQTMENIASSEAGHIKYVLSDSDTAETPVDQNTGKNMTEGMVRYQLLNLKTEFFDKIQDADEHHSFSRKTFKYEGARFKLEDPLVPRKFHGTTYRNNQASFPWDWFDGACNKVKEGDWFFDPAYAINTLLGRPVSGVDDYIYNPYLGIYPKNHPEAIGMIASSDGIDPFKR